MKIVTGTSDIARKPNAISQLSPTSPLFWETGAVRALMDTCGQGVPVNILPEPMSGVSAPYSVAGLLLMHNAETLSGFVIGQCVKAGAPMLYGSSWTTFDMKYSAAIITSPETHMLRVAGCQMARFYEVPSHTTAPNSDANLHDEQNSWERNISNLCSILAGNDIIMNSGMFATGLTISLEQLVMDDEMNGIIRRIWRGFQVNDETLGAQAIDDVGNRGSFLMHDHTLDLLHSDEFRHNVLIRADTYDDWRKKGAPDVAALAAERVKEILGKGPRCQLPKVTTEKMIAILDALE
jgi:trimethylamine--corrinoid protein Co-methyltransferase